MIRRLFLSALFACVMTASSGHLVQAYDSNFGFAFGYATGQANQFRNRLPAPPYFSVYPPVYYGKRYARPYGESPFASWPLLQSSADYHAVPKQTPTQMGNPHVITPTPCASCGKPVVDGSPEVVGKMLTIINPFVPSNSTVVAAENHE